MEAAQVVDLQTGEVLSRCPNCADLEDQVEGYKETVDKQSRRIGSLKRKVEAEGDPLSHPKGKEIIGVIERWKRACDHPNAKISEDRVKLVKARLRDGYSIEQLELAIDGLGTYRYVVTAQRKREGKPSQRYDQLSHALKSGEAVERFANLGAQVCKQGLVAWA